MYEDLSKSQGYLHAKEPARAHGFSAKNDNSNGPPCNDILAIMCWFGLAQTKPSLFMLRLEASIPRLVRLSVFKKNSLLFLFYQNKSI